MRLLDRHPVEALHVELATEIVVRGSTRARLHWTDVVALSR